MVRNCIFVLLLLIATNAIGDIWGSIAVCLSNPCNCGFGNRIETWNNQTNDKGPRNLLCPPWNKEDGRDRGTCLLNSPYPGVFVPWYLNYCAENTTESNYFNPKIKIRYQSCNSAACWTLSKSLSADGECMVWPTGYAWPLLRICARIANPENPVTKTPADPGYEDPIQFKKKHLNNEGVLVADKVIIGVDGQPIEYKKPKLCAYTDPSVYDTSTSGINLLAGRIDLMDFNPAKQPFHRTTQPHPIARILLFFLEMTLGTSQTIDSLLSTLYDKIGDYIPTFKLQKYIFEFLSILIGLFKDAIAAIIKEFGQLNRVVDEPLGCVELPLGPYPPPYCHALPPFVSDPQTQAICQTGQNGQISDSIESSKCVRSKLVNNFISNSIRVTVDNFIPLCAHSEDPTNTDKCVGLVNIGSLSPKVLHVMTAYRDTIPKCAVPIQRGAVCVNTKIPFNCSVSSNGCEDGFRVVYGTKIGSTIFPSNYFRDDLRDCSPPSSDNGPCQVIWGVNTGEFQDVQLQFPSEEDISNLASPLIQTFSINDTSGTQRTFTASMYRQSTDRSSDLDSSFYQEPNQICAVEGRTLIGCEIRQQPSKPVLSKSLRCPPNQPTCTTDYYEPQFRVTLKTGADSTSAIIQPASIANADTSTSSINLAGYNFSSFVTDENYISQPFTVYHHSPTPSSIYGAYKNDANPLSDNNAVYLNGLEYVNGSYIQGGKYACLNTDSLAHCPSDTKNCVLSYLSNAGVVNCTDLYAKIGQYTGLRLYNTQDFSGCVNQDSMMSKTGQSIIIQKCSTGGYAYVNNTELCTVSNHPTQRKIPDAGGPIDDNAYYDITSSYDSTINPSLPPYDSTITSSLQQLTPQKNQDGTVQARLYDRNLFALRDKTPYESGLCVPIPQPVCKAITDTTPNKSNGNATWAEATVGTKSKGTCITGYSPTKPNLERYCLSNFDTKTFGFEDVSAETTGICEGFCQGKTIKKRVYCSCMKDGMLAVLYASDMTVTYALTKYGESSNAVCKYAGISATDFQGSVSCVAPDSNDSFSDKGGLVNQCLQAVEKPGGLFNSILLLYFPTKAHCSAVICRISDE